MADQSIDVCLFNGGIRTSEQEYMAQLMRRKSKVLVAFGSCASEGCIPGLGNMNTRKQIFDTVYKEGSATTPENPQDLRPQQETNMPEGTLHLPVFYDTLKTLDQTVDVDYYLPGCPPEAENIWKAIVAILEGKLPPKGSTIGVNTTVCDECKRKRDVKKIKKFYRTWQIIPDEETCLLEQGLLCCGIATRAGCGALCPVVNSPCIGCHGGNDGVDDYGARLMSGVASVIDSNDPDEIDKIISEGIPDPVGSFYRFSLASSELRRKKKVASG
jgi:F420-non-reducing hydrogenase small subunit